MHLANPAYLNKRVDLFGFKDMYEYIDEYDLYRWTNQDGFVSWEYESDDVSLVTIKSNQKPTSKVSFLYDWGIIEPNTEYNCIKVYGYHLFMIRKYDIRKYKNIFIDTAPLNKVVKIRDKNITNFVHWAVSYDYKEFQCLREFKDYFGAAESIATPYKNEDYKTGLLMTTIREIIASKANSICNYLIEYLKDEKSTGDKILENSSLREDEKFIFNIIIESSNIREEYQKCLFRTPNKESLLQEIHNATKAAIILANNETYSVNVAKTLVYNKAADIFYKNIEGTAQDYIEDGMIKIMKWMAVAPITHTLNATFSITDNNNTLINFLFLLLGSTLHVGLQVGVVMTIEWIKNVLPQASPNFVYTIDCEKNKVNVHFDKLIINALKDNDYFKITSFVKQKSGFFIFKGQNYLYLFDIIRRSKIFIKQYHSIREILLNHNAIMLIPLFRQYKLRKPFEEIHVRL